MRWHVAALVAVWLLVMGWCGNVVVGQPVAEIMNTQPQEGQIWGLTDSADVVETPDDDQRERLYYLPTIPIKRHSGDDDSSWLLQSQVQYPCSFS